MSAEEKRMERMLFNYRTTNATDFNMFNRGKMQPLPPYEKRYSIKRPKEEKCHNRLKDLQTIYDLKDDADLPFTLWIVPNEITRGNPHKIQQPFNKPIDEELEQVIKTRPRVVMYPGVSLDDINPEGRKVLIENAYLSESRRSQEECATKAFPRDSVKAPLPGKPAPVKPITLPQFEFAYVSPYWRMDSVKWDNEQLRSYVDPTFEFWKRRPGNSCTVCLATEAREKARLQQIRNNLLTSK